MGGRGKEGTAPRGVEAGVGSPGAARVGGFGRLGRVRGGRRIRGVVSVFVC